MRVRGLKAGDAAGIKRLMLELYDENPISSTFDEKPSGAELDGLIGRKLEGIASGGVVDLVAEEGGRIVAECELVGTGMGTGVIGIIVQAGSRRKGIGKALISRALELAGGISVSRIYANIRKENGPALAFFTTCGFEKRLDGEIVVMARSASAA